MYRIFWCRVRPVIVFSRVAKQTNVYGKQIQRAPRFVSATAHFRHSVAPHAAAKRRARIPRGTLTVGPSIRIVGSFRDSVTNELRSKETEHRGCRPSSFGAPFLSVAYLPSSSISRRDGPRDAVEMLRLRKTRLALAHVTFAFLLLRCCPQQRWHHRRPPRRRTQHSRPEIRRRPPEAVQVLVPFRQTLRSLGRPPCSSSWSVGGSQGF